MHNSFESGRIRFYLLGLTIIFALFFIFASPAQAANDTTAEAATQLWQQESGKLDILLKVAQDTDQGRHPIPIEIELRSVDSVLPEKNPGLKVNIIEMDNENENSYAYALILTNPADEPRNLSCEAHLTVTEPLVFSTDGTEWVQEDSIVFNDGISELFLTVNSKTFSLDGRFLIRDEEIDFAAPANLTQEHTTEVGDYLTTESKTDGLDSFSISSDSNNTPETALEIFPGQLITTSIDYQGDQKWFKINVDHTCSIVSNITNNSGVAYYTLYNASLNKLQGGTVYSSGKSGYKVSPGVYYIKISDHLSSIDYLNSCITLTVNLREEDQWENNDTSEHALEITAGQQLSGIAIEARNDEDWFKINIDHTCSIVSNITNNSGVAYYTLYNASLNKLQGGNVYSLGKFGYKVSPGVYYIKISDYLSSIDYLNSNIFLTVTLVNDYDQLITLGRSWFCFFFGDPVNVATGNYTYEYTDLSIPARGIPLEFTRYYNSLDAYAGPLGKGWQHNYNTHLTVNEDNSVSVLHPDGHMTLFTYSNGVYTRQPGSFETLTHNHDGTYTLTFKDQSKYIYDFQGKLVQTADKNNNTVNLQYSDSLLTTVTEPGRTLQFAYDQNNRLSQITDPAGRSVAFTYDANGNLATSQDLNGGITTYTYGDYGLASIIDPNNHTLVKNTYDTSARVIEQEDGKGNKTAYAYNTTNKKNTITDPRGNAVVFYYDDKYRITRIDYPQNITSSYTYDANYNRSSETDKNGHTTTYTYDNMGNLLTKTDPAPLGYTTTYVYDSLNNPVQVTDAAGYITGYTYDGNSNLLAVSKAVSGETATTSFAYDEYGQVSSITDPNNNTTSVTYDQYGNRTAVIDPLGNITTHTYDLIGRKLTETDPRGNQPGANPESYRWTYTYDQAGNLLTVTDPLGNVTTNTYDANNNLISTTDPKGSATAFAYDENNKLITQTDPQNNVTTYQYDANGNLSSITDANNHTTGYQYDFLERPVSTTYPDGSAETLTLDGNGNVIARTDNKGNTTNYEYDALNRLIEITDPAGGAITMEYDPLGNQISVTDQRGNTTAYTYDQASRLLAVINPLEHTTGYTYDLTGNRLTITNPKGATWTNNYDNANRLVRTTDPLGHESTLQYDSAGNVVISTNANGVGTTYAYDALDRLASVTDDLDNTTDYTYDENGNLTGVTDANDNTTIYTYDNMNRLTAITNPLDQTTGYAYDPAGNRIGSTKPDGNTISYGYDSSNRLAEITYPGSNRISFNYDANGNRTEMTDPEGTTLYSYNNLDRLTSVTRAVYSIGYDYDLAGNIAGIIYPDGLNITYAYNELNQLASVSDAVYAATFTYNELGNIISEQLPNGVTVSYAYDDNGRLTSLQHIKGGATLTGVEYTLDNLGNRTSVTDENGKVTGYTYDNLNQLTEVQYPDTGSVTYTYDPVGNRLSAGGVSYTYDSANRLLQVNTTPYGYDANGNLLSVGESVYYDYDYENRLIHYADGTNTYSYTYDGDGNRLTQTVSGAVYGSYNYIYDINAGLPLLLAEIDSQGNANNYLYANGLYSRTGPGGMLFFHADGIGSVSVVSDVYGTPINRYTYDPFGNPLTVNETVDNMFRFTDEPYDPSGLIFLRARYYDPSTGRFLTPDTYPGELTDPLSQNLYVYCSNNPVLYIDPSGHMTVGEAWGSFKASISMAADSNTYAQSWNVTKDGLGNTWNDAQNTIVYKQLAPLAKDAWECPLIGGGVKTVGARLVKFSAGKKICEGAGNAVANLGKSYGKFGTVVENPGVKITGFSGHAVNQAITRGVTTEVIQNTVKNPVAVLSQRGGNSFAYVSNEAVVVVKNTGEIITTYGKGNFDAIVQQVLKEAIK